MLLFLAGPLLALSAACEGEGSPDRRVGAHTDGPLIRDVSYGDDPAQLLDLHLQPTRHEAESGPGVVRPTLLFFHGGGWIGGSRDADAWLFVPFLDRGWHVVSATYRKGPGTAPAAVLDARAALRWLLEHADEYGFDLNSLVVGGSSAGGLLALLAARAPSDEDQESPDRAVQAVVNWAGITDIGAQEAYLARFRPEANWALAWIGDPARVSAISDRHSPMELIDPSMPAVITVHAADDEVVPPDQARRLHARLEALGVRNRLVLLPEGGHLGFPPDALREAFRAVFEFLEPVVDRR